MADIGDRNREINAFTLQTVGQILVAFFLLNLLLSPINAKASSAADLLTTIGRIAISGFLVGKLGRHLSGDSWLRRLWAAIPLLIVASLLASVIFAVVQGRPFAIGVFLTEVIRDVVEIALAFGLAVSLAKRRVEASPSTEASA